LSHSNLLRQFRHHAPQDPLVAWSMSQFIMQSKCGPTLFRQLEVFSPRQCASLRGRRVVEARHGDCDSVVQLHAAAGTFKMIRICPILCSMGQSIWGGGWFVR
ncbi:unnamed protein product, partial [Choristocarpus tenellus]